jgi:hypothetical protein
LLWSSQAAAQVAGIWIGDEKTDPITDNNTALAFIYDDETQGSAGLRCRNGHADFLLTTREPNFTPGEKKVVTIRMGSDAPKDFKAIATEPNLLVVDAPPVEIMVPVLKSSRFAARFSGTYGRTVTMTFTPGIRANTLHMVGQVLAACQLAAYPQAEIDAEMKAIEAPKRKR